MKLREQGGLITKKCIVSIHVKFLSCGLLMKNFNSSRKLSQGAIITVKLTPRLHLNVLPHAHLLTFITQVLHLLLPVSS